MSEHSERIHGDVQPEDAWDDGDSEDQKLRVLERVVLALQREANEKRRLEALRLLAKLEALREIRTQRIINVREDLETLGNG